MVGGRKASCQGQSGLRVGGETQKGLNPAAGGHKGVRRDDVLGCLAEWEGRVGMHVSKVHCFLV